MGGVRWEGGKKPSEYFERKKKELHSRVIPSIAWRIAENLEKEIKRRTPTGVRWTPPNGNHAVTTPTGHLKRSIKMDSRGKWESSKHTICVSTNVQYAPYVEYGTSPHVIKPKTPGGSLAWFNSSGNKVHAKIVHHPGTQPVYMFTKSVGAVRPRVPLMANPFLSAWAEDNRARISTMKRNG